MKLENHYKSEFNSSFYFTFQLWNKNHCFSLVIIHLSFISCLVVFIRICVLHTTLHHLIAPLDIIYKHFSSSYFITLMSWKLTWNVLKMSWKVHKGLYLFFIIQWIEFKFENLKYNSIYVTIILNKIKKR
jgi:hypothetical protein